MAKIKSIVHYNGSRYKGFQIQPNQITIQGEIEKALEKTFHKKIKIVAAGRTDRGVHSLGQVISFDVDTTIDIGNLPRVINYHLPEDISIMESEYVDDDFSARFSAKSKVYKYLIYNYKYESGFYDSLSYNYPHYLDIERMKKAVEPIIGTFDFSSFMGRDSNVKDAIRTIYSIDIKRDGRFVEITFHGKSFLRNMIRIIVGSLCDIGRGKLETDFLKESLEKKDRKMAGYTAPPSGLYLMEVRY